MLFTINKIINLALSAEVACNDVEDLLHVNGMCSCGRPLLSNVNKQTIEPH